MRLPLFVCLCAPFSFHVGSIGSLGRLSGGLAMGFLTVTIETLLGGGTSSISYLFFVRLGSSWETLCVPSGSSFFVKSAP